MTRNWHNPERPTPAELAAWVEGELDGSDAARVEAWLRDHPDDAAEAEASSRLTGLFRDHPPPEPAPRAWDHTLARIAARTRHRPTRRWPALLLVGLAGAAALLAAAVARDVLWPRPPQHDRGGLQAHVELPPEDDNDDPFVVAASSEIDVLAMDARDAGRLLIGHLLDPFVIASPGDVELVNVEPDDDGTTPHLHKGRLPMVVVRADQEP